LPGRICIVPRLSGLGGMVSFQSRFINGLTKRNIPVSFDANDPETNSLLIVGGTRQLGVVFRARRRGVNVVQRLNGMNWLHRKRRTSLRQYLRAESNNLVLTFIRRYLADAIIYQSQFSKSWWEGEHGILSKPSCVIHNGIDLDIYSPFGTAQRPEQNFRILLVEGHLGQENSQGLDNALSLVDTLNSGSQLPVELVVVGNVGQEIQTRASARTHSMIHFLGVVPRDQIPIIDRSAHLLFSGDLNAACPNSVIEAMACGLPVLSYDTGALAELVTEGSGEVVPYGSNHWNLEPPKIGPLAAAARRIMMQNDSYRQAARIHAESAFGIDLMVDRYLEVLI
jgi:glycosyltransferase involved in cell wall biosynthesis